MSMYRDNLTILIQGPLDVTSINNIENYKKYGKVVVSTWSDMNEGLFTDLEKHDDIKVVKQKLPNVDEVIGIDKKSTFYYAISSIHNGLKEIDTEYVLKTRSDEYYYNLEPFLEHMEKDKIICGNIFVRREVPYHFGDHIFLCKTEDLFQSTNNLLDSYNKKTKIEKWMEQKAKNVAETILCKAILKEMEVDLEGDDRQIFINNIEIININECAPFTASWKHGRQTYVNVFKNMWNVFCSIDY